MRRAIGVLLITLSITAVGQSLWEFYLWERGRSRWTEAHILDRSFGFAGRRFDVRDDQPRDSVHSYRTRPGTVEIALDGRHIVEPSYALVRTALVDRGRYHGWVDAWTFRDQATGEQSLWITRRLQHTGSERPRFEILVVNSGGRPHRQVYRVWQLGFDYRRFRSTQFVTDGTSGAVPLSVLDGAYFPLVWLVFPFGTFILGLALIRRGRAQRLSSAV